MEPEPAAYTQALEEALNLAGMQRHMAISGLVARWPDFLEGWAQLGEAARDLVEAYACFRVGYHRGLGSPAAERLARIGLGSLGASRQSGVSALLGRTEAHG